MKRVFQQPFDMGWATVVAAVIASATTFIFWILGPDVESITEAKNERISELVKELEVEKEMLQLSEKAKINCLTEKASLAATLTAEQANRKQIIESERAKFSCKSIELEYGNERELWNKRNKELELNLQDATLRLNQAENDKEAAENEARKAINDLNALRSRMDRNIDLQLSYDSVEKILEDLASESTDFNEKTSVERLRAFQLEVIRELSLIEDFRSRSDEVEYYFNADIKEFLDRLLDRQGETDAPLDAETYQRELGELLKNHNSREGDFEKKLDLLLNAEKNLNSN